MSGLEVLHVASLPFLVHFASALIASYVLLYVCNRPTVSRTSDRAKCM